jgi:D-mannonate dehydratase
MPRKNENGMCSLGLKLSTQICDMMENFCAQIWNQHVRINFESNISFVY